MSTDDEAGAQEFDPTWGGTKAAPDTRTTAQKILPNFLGGQSAPVAANQNATWNNALKGGRNIFTGHIHRLAVTPITDWNGRRYGVDTGTLSDFGPEVNKFTYGEDNPYNWASGFAVATFDEDGMLLPPELVTVINNKAYWRGKPL